MSSHFLPVLHWTDKSISIKKGCYSIQETNMASEIAFIFMVLFACVY